MKVPLCKPFVGEEECKAIASTIDSGWLISGPNVKRFEEEVARYSQVAYAVATNSGTSALILGLLASGVTSRDYVVVPSYTFVATANAVHHAGAVPLIWDVDRTNGVLEDKTKELHMIFVDPLGVRDWDYPKPWPGQVVIEDAACAIGAKDVGKDVTLATFSFHASKMITTGEGGMIITDIPEIAEKARVIRNQGCLNKAMNNYQPNGWNLRMTDMQGAMGIEQMKKLPEIIERRHELAARYAELIHFACLPLTPPEFVEGRVWQSYTCTVEKDRDRIMADLAERGIQTRIGTQAVHRIYGEPDENYPNASWLADHTIALPIFPQMTKEEQNYVIESLKEVL